MFRKTYQGYARLRTALRLPELSAIMQVRLDDKAFTASMLNLFSPLSLGRLRLPNRIVLAALPSGFAAPGGFASHDLANYYVERALGGAGMLVIEHTCALPPADRTAPHLGL